MCAPRHAGPLCRRLRGDVRHEGGGRGSPAAGQHGADAARARAASGEDETGRSLARSRGLRLSRVSPAQAHERSDLGADAATRLLPASVAVAARDGAGARACASADASRSGVTRISAASSRTSIRCSAAGGSTFARAMRRTTSSRSTVRRGTPARAAAQARGLASAAPVGPTPWHRPFFEALGLFRLRGTIQYPGVAHATT